LIVSRLSFGSIDVRHRRRPVRVVSKVDQAGADELVARAIDGGINFFNSADVYAGGESERMLGKAIGARRQQVVIATKLGNRMGEALVESGLSRRQGARGRRREPRAAGHRLHRRLSAAQGPTR